MKLLESKKLKLPRVYFISDREEIKDIPVGVPFIFGDEKHEEDIIRLLEYETLYQAALKSGYPFNFRKILQDNGYKDLKDFGRGDSVYMDYITEKGETGDLQKFGSFDPGSKLFKDFIRDSAAYVDMEVLKDLKVFPIWLDTIEKAISTNIHNFATFNNNMYNKKLEGMYGALDLVAPSRNLIIIDISGSIPRAVSTTCLALAKNLVETFYADLIITGSISTLYPYENIHELNVERAYDNGMNNDQAYFKKLVSSDVRHYKTAIVFGDNDSPCRVWTHGDKTISEEDGKKLCKWEVDKLISLHTNGTTHLAAYGTWFTPKETERVKDWVKYLA